MRNFISCVIGLMMLTGGSAVASERAKNIEYLSEGTGELLLEGSQICTVSKIAEHFYLTAKHCMTDDPRLTYQIRFGNFRVDVTGAYVPYTKNSDWAILAANTKLPEMKTLKVKCGVQPFMGMELAYYGFPGGVKGYYGEGYVVTDDRRGGQAFYTSIVAAPGASGSPTIDKDGYVIGVLVTGLYYSTGFSMIPLATGINPIPSYVCNVE
jgi:hypothetical protein